MKNDFETLNACGSTAKATKIPPGFGQEGFEVDYARAQTWIEFGYADAHPSVLTKVLFTFNQPVIAIIEWLMEELEDANKSPANDN